MKRIFLCLIAVMIFTAGCKHEGSDSSSLLLILGTTTQKNLVKLYASDGQADDFLGQSAAVSGNYAIAGAHSEDGGEGSLQSAAGAAYIFTRGSGGWVQEQILHASDKQANDNFGFAVAISGTYAIVGAVMEDGGTGEPVPDSGAAYIYERNSSGVWEQKAILHASDPQTGDRFGCSVAISGTYAMVGAELEDGGAGDPITNCGAVYVFERNLLTGNWFFKTKLLPSDGQANDSFGFSVSLSGTYAIIGANLEDGGAGNPASSGGAAYVFERNSGTGAWEEKNILHASDEQAGDNFGYSVSISGDYAAVGSPGEDGGTGDSVSMAGAVYVFRRNSSGNWVEWQILRASDMQADDRFGFSLSISGNDLLVGAPYEDYGNGDTISNAGAAYLFSVNSAGSWAAITILHGIGAEAGDTFGWSVGISNGTGIIGARETDNDTLVLNNTGAVYFY